MSYRFANEESLVAGLRRIALEQVDRAVGEVDNPSLPTEATVHEVRKRSKKLRGLLRLVRPALGKTFKRENAAIRDAAQLLAHARDAAIVATAFDELVAESDLSWDPSQLAELRAAVVEHATTPPCCRETPLAEFRLQFESLRTRISKWELRKGSRRIVAAGFAAEYGKARDAMRAAFAEPSPELFHEWRKGVKYHGYHLRLVERVWPRAVKPWLGAANRLGEVLGKDHDLATLSDRLVQSSSEGGEISAVLLELAQAAQADMRGRARLIGERLFAFRPRELERWLRRLW